MEGIKLVSLALPEESSLPATLYDILAGARFAAALARRNGINVLHARAHVPMAMALLATTFRARETNLRPSRLDGRGVFRFGNLDGAFAAVSAGQTIGTGGYCARGSDRCTYRTFARLVGSQEIKPAEQIQVIPCCVDFHRFADTETSTRNGSNRFEVVYAGSLVGLYLVEEMGRFFKAVKAQRPNAFLRILSVSPPEQGADALKSAGLDEGDFEILAVAPHDVPRHLSQAQLGVSFRKSAFAQIAASPTKIPEYLAVGLPVVCNSGIGDMDEFVERGGRRRRSAKF